MTAHSTAFVAMLAMIMLAVVYGIWRQLRKG